MGGNKDKGSDKDRGVGREDKGSDMVVGLSKDKGSDKGLTVDKGWVIGKGWDKDCDNGKGSDKGLEISTDKGWDKGSDKGKGGKGTGTVLVFGLILLTDRESLTIAPCCSMVARKGRGNEDTWST